MSTDMAEALREQAQRFRMGEGVDAGALLMTTAARIEQLEAENAHLRKALWAMVATAEEVLVPIEEVTP